MALSFLKSYLYDLAANLAINSLAIDSQSILLL
jgi:hypothetical protein